MTDPGAVVTYVALLRAVNVGGIRITMDDLRALAASLGYGNVRSLLQTGNLVFDGERERPAALERRLAKVTGRRLGVVTEFFVRTSSEWSTAIEANPLIDAAVRDPSHLVVVFLQESPSGEAVRALRSAIAGPETVEVVGRQAYIAYPEGIGRSGLTLSRIERALGTPGTGRNWNTVRRIGALATGRANSSSGPSRPARS